MPEARCIVGAYETLMLLISLIASTDKPQTYIALSDLWCLYKV